ncbi:MAG TPA: 4Fe-4S double cluster binding domain-containing protein [Dehalococcoidales bacterium]
MKTNREQQQFNSNPASSIEKAIRDYIANNPNNRFLAFPEEAIWDSPVVGFANGNDPIFQEYKTIIGDFHLTPREVLETYIDTTVRGDKSKLAHISVISFALPATLKTRESNRRENKICSVRWNHTRFEGQEVVARLSRHLVTLIEDMGHMAVAPELARWFEPVQSPSGLSSKWSQRHAAYAAGLGTFGLSDGFITPVGIAIRIGSVVCDLEIPPTPRKYANHRANCLFYSRGTCRKCAERCPAGAITEKGHDKNKCFAYLQEMRKIAQQEDKTEGYIGKAYLGCGFCQTGVPCEDKIPVEVGSNK